MSFFKTKIGVVVVTAFLSVVGSVNAQVEVFQVVFQENFDGAAGAGLNGTSPTIGTGTWSATDDFFADGSIALSGNSSASISIGDVINDAAGTPAGLFELSATFAPTEAGWYSLGFSQQAAPTTNNHFINRDGVGTLLQRANTEVDMFAGNGFTPNGLTPIGSSNVIDGPLIGPNNTDPRVLTIEIDLRNADGTDNFGTVTYFDSSQEDPEIGSFNYTSEPAIATLGDLTGMPGTAPTEPMFNTIMLSGNNGAMGTYSNLTLSQLVVGSVLPCDANMDGTVNFLDIAPFIVALGDPAFNPEADCNEDGVDNFLDIAPFILELAGG